MTTETSTPPQNIAGGRQRVLGLLASAAVGVVLAVQSRINGTLGAHLGDAVAAAVISFGLGSIILLVCTVLTPSGRRGMRRIGAEVRAGSGLSWWHCLGGLSGAYLVFSQGMAAATLGIALFTIGVVAGQVANGMVVDRIGMGPGGPQRVTVPRLLGAVLAVGAVVLAVAAQLRASNPNWFVLLPALAGVLMAWQQAVNGRVRQVADSTLSASTLNFVVGTIALLAAFAVKAALIGFPSSFPSEPWLYIGGVLGIFVIGGSAALVRYTGVLVLSMGMIAGQLLGALVLDLVVPTPGTNVEAATLIGIGLTFVSVAVASMPDRPGHRSTDLPR